jgi:hypothetical protein
VDVKRETYNLSPRPKVNEGFDRKPSSPEVLQLQNFRAFTVFGGGETTPFLERRLAPNVSGYAPKRRKNVMA